jgi:hypothetical protein
MLILNCIPESIGWSPIQHMITLAAELFEARILEFHPKHPSSLAKALSVVGRRSRPGNDREPCLLVCAGPGDLEKILSVPGWRYRFGVVGAWIIDSFWVANIPKVIRVANPFDILFVTSLEDVDSWRSLTGAPTTWLPWGTDALRLGSASSKRQWDITRVGRQPPEWEEDQEAVKSAEPLGIKYRPRPQSDGFNTLENQKWMMNVYADSKYVLAFSNAANPEAYTHPTRQYLTGRWVDGLAGGAILAGVSPQGEGSQALLWKGATLDFGSVRRAEGLKVLKEALQDWNPSYASKNYEMALSNLDWRWRFKVLADAYQLKPQSLLDEISLLEAKISHAKSRQSA